LKEKTTKSTSTLYTIKVKTLEGNNLTFTNVTNYEVIDGFLHFTDNRTNKAKMFAVSNTEIEVSQ